MDALLSSNTDALTGDANVTQENTAAVEAANEAPVDKDAEIVAAAIEAFNNAKDMSGATAAIELLNSLNLTPDQLQAVASALGLNTDALTGSTESVQESAAATAENTEALANTSPEEYDSDVYADQFSAEWSAAVDAYEAAQDAYQLALDMVKDGASPDEAKEAVNLSDENFARLEKEAAEIQPWREEQGVLLKGLSDAFTSLGDAILGGSASAEGGDSGYSGVYDGTFFEKNTKAAKKETKETVKNTKELKKNTNKRSEVDVNYEGAGFDTSGDKPKLNVDVNFTPEGEEPSSDNSNGGLLNWLQELLNADTLEAKIGLIRDGWTTIKNFLGVDENTPIGVLLELLKNNWTTIRQFLGIPENSLLDVLIKALLDNWPGILSALGIPKDATISTVVKAAIQALDNLFDVLGIPENSPLRLLLNLIKGVFEPEAEDALAADDKDVDVEVDLENGKQDKEAQKTIELAGKELETDVEVDLENGKQDSEAKDSIGYAGKSFETTVKTLVKKGGTWIQEAVDIAQLGNGTVDRTLDQDIKMSVLDAIKMAIIMLGDGTVKRTLEQSVARGTWDGYAFTAAQLTGDVGRTLTQHVEKGSSWNADAFTAAKLTAGVTRTLTQHVAKGSSWNADAFIAAKLTAGVTRTLTQHVAKGSSWNSDAFTGAKIGGGTVTRTVKVQCEKSNKWSDTANDLTKRGDHTITITVKMNVIGKTANITVQKSGGNNMKIILKKLGGIIMDSGLVRNFARGGMINGGLDKYFSDIPGFAGGGMPNHGTVFVAGEAGPEIMGHINGRTEILNKSQIAEAIYGAVVSGMGAAVNALGKYIANHMSTCTNAIVETIGNVAAFTSAGGFEYHAPAVATGGVMPYDVAMQIARSTQELQNTLDANNEDLIQAMVSAIGNASQSIVQAMMTQMMRGNTTGRGLTSGQVIDDINRSGLMFGQSPIKGV